MMTTTTTTTRTTTTHQGICHVTQTLLVPVPHKPLPAVVQPVHWTSMMSRGAQVSAADDGLPRDSPASMMSTNSTPPTAGHPSA